MPAFNTAVNGLKMQNETMTTIANNIANTNTVAYKGDVAHQADLFYQTVRASTASQPIGVQLGAGGIVNATSMNQAQGSFQRTGTPSDVAISGRGLFVMKESATGTYHFQRAGDFTINGSAKLSNYNGMQVQGILGNKSSASGDATDPGTGTPSSVTIGDVVIPTTFVSQAAATTATGQITLGNVAPLAGSTLTINGVTVTFAAAATAGLTVRIATTPIYSASAQAVEVAASITINTVAMGMTAASASSSSVVSLTASSSGTAPNAIALSSTVANTGLIIRSGTMSGGSEIGALLEEGVVSFSVAADGAVNLFGTNGTTRRIAYILLTQFGDPSGLVREGNNLFGFTPGATTFSGGNVFTPSIDTRKPNTNGMGTLQNNTLELSNVDLSQEFVDMITSQRAFEANARIITTSDEMLQTVVNLRR